jgi:hypothetical protein
MPRSSVSRPEFDMSARQIPPTVMACRANWIGEVETRRQPQHPCLDRGIDCDEPRALAAARFRFGMTFGRGLLAAGAQSRVTSNAGIARSGFPEAAMITIDGCIRSPIYRI